MYLNPQNTNNFLGDNMRKIIDQLGQTGVDVTSYIEKVKTVEGKAKWDQYMTCMNGLFFTGVIDTRLDPKCLVSLENTSHKPCMLNLNAAFQLDSFVCIYNSLFGDRC
jgi:hypothetical protein